jgi:hypothetical protein
VLDINFDALPRNESESEGFGGGVGAGLAGAGGPPFFFRFFAKWPLHRLSTLNLESQLSWAGAERASRISARDQDRGSVATTLRLLIFSAASSAISSCCDFGGDPAKDMELQVTAADQSGAYHPLPDGGSIDFIFGGQGLIMLAIGLSGRNVEKCQAAISASLVDPVRGSVGASQSSQGSFTVNEGDGWWALDGSNVRNAINLLPCYSTGGSFDKEAWRLEVTVTDARARSARLTQMIIPGCRQTSCSALSRCHQSCSPPDAGALDAGPCP